MGLLSRLFKKEQNQQEPPKIQENPPEITTEWQELPAFIETDPAEYELVSVLATAIAAGDHPESEFVVKKIQQRNPEVRLVSIIAASLAAELSEDSQFVVKKIYQKKN